MKKKALLKENGETKLVDYTKELRKIMNDKEETHLCWEYCVNADVLDCQKVADNFKKTIDQYEFITDGIQTFDKYNQVELFKVLGCENYQSVDDIEKEKERGREKIYIR